ncbi:hypothetical protein VUR80DRAFT_2894 [Thermomyces stellatus]
MSGSRIAPLEGPVLYMPAVLLKIVAISIMVVDMPERFEHAGQHRSPAQDSTAILLSRTIASGEEIDDSDTLCKLRSACRQESKQPHA